MAYSYTRADCDGMETCPGKVVAEMEEEVWKLMELHAKIAHDEDASKWDDETRMNVYFKIKMPFPRLLTRPLARFMFKQAKLEEHYDTLARLIEEEAARDESIG